MTKTKSTKRALLSSLLVLVVCVSMLIGTTYAWFTDSVTSGRNIIQAGNLDAKLSFSAWDKATNTWGDYQEVTSDTIVFGKDAKYEPGYTEVVKFKVENLGSLAFKYQLGMHVFNETPSTNVYDEEFYLSDYIKVGVMDAEVDGWSVDRASAAEYATMNIKDAKNLALVPNPFGGYFANLPLEPAGSFSNGVPQDMDEWAFVIHMPTTVGNEANHKSDVEAPSIEFAVNLLATQYTHEKDSFDNQYDKDATYPPIAWDGSVDISWFDAGKTEFTISNGAQLAGMAALGNQLGGKTITLDSDINLGGKNWTPITIFDPEHSFTFDGGNHTIYNLSVTGRSNGGLFDNSAGTIKNLKLSDAQIETDGRSAILAGRHYGDIINCHVKDSTIEDSYWAVGGIVGLFNSGNIKNCSVTNVNVKSNGGVGGIVGVLNETSGTRTIENCSVIGGTIENIGLYGSTYSGGGIVGMIYINNSTVNITGCNSTATLKGKYIFEICPPADDDIT